MKNLSNKIKIRELTNHSREFQGKYGDISRLAKSEETNSSPANGQSFRNVSNDIIKMSEAYC